MSGKGFDTRKLMTGKDGKAFLSHLMEFPSGLHPWKSSQSE